MEQLQLQASMHARVDESVSEVLGRPFGSVTPLERLLAKGWHKTINLWMPAATIVEVPPPHFRLVAFVHVTH